MKYFKIFKLQMWGIFDRFKMYVEQNLQKFA